MFLKTLVISVFAISIVPSVAFATNGYDSNQNHPEYWGETCDKTEFNGNVYEFTPGRDGVTKVVVKGGTTNKVYDTPPFVDLTAEINEKSGKPYGISHVIECFDITEEPEVCEYDSTLAKDDPDCKQPEEPETPVTPETPGSGGEVLGDKTPETLPKTGADAGTIVVAGIVLSGFALSLAQMRDEEDIAEQFENAL